jgi:hypothetical protein
MNILNLASPGFVSSVKPNNFGNKNISTFFDYYPLSFSPRGERFCSFPRAGRLGWGLNIKDSLCILIK